MGSPFVRPKRNWIVSVLNSIVHAVMGIIVGLCILLLSKLAMEVNGINLNR